MPLAAEAMSREKGYPTEMPSFHVDLPDEQLLTVSEVADAFRVSKMTVYRLVESGKLPTVRLGRSIRIPAQRVRDYVRRSAASR